MDNKNNFSLTNLLLLIIAGLLLVLVIQNSPSKPKSPQHSENFEQGNFSNPHEPQAPTGVHGDEPEFNPSDMLFAATTCPSDATLTLAEPGCSGKGADERRKLITDSFAKGLGISAVFDAIVKKYGEKALTEQAIEIRRSMGK